MATNSPAGRISAWRILLMPGLFAVVGVLVLVALGIWQLQRLAWKEALIARIETRIAAAPVPAPDESSWSSARWADDEYRPVTASGRYLYERQVYVHGNATLEGSTRMGYFVLTPLQQAGGSIIVVNRGFMPMEFKRDAAAVQRWRAGERDGEQVSVAGLLRAPQSRGWFVPVDVPEKGEWFTRDPQAIAQAGELERVAPFLIDAFDTHGDGASMWPKGGLTVVSFPNNHLDYAFTWFGLAVTLLVVFALFACRQLKSVSARTESL
ncbi:MAG: SURF1 family protein [Pseudochelatococcus sp.]|jgi:surfeit locus 1 family protein|uniref:SURF1 family protein n=1 Tax=Pseudochelatococcus sp. TaxID=2020869 RepID=UPI003D9053F9